jgi:hypothetical protein
MNGKRFASCAVVVAVALGLPALASPAQADPAPVSAVGGGAWAIGVAHITESDTLFNDNLPYGVAVINQSPSVTLPEDGSPGTIEASGPVEAIGPISARLGHVTTEGNLSGTPYAHSTAQVASVHIPGLDVAAINTECVWDTTGAVGSTVLVDASGHQFTVPPNTGVALPGINGYVTLNNQFTEEDQGRQVIVVAGVQLFLYATGPLGTTTFTEIDLGVSSCDPLIVPLVGKLAVKVPSGG